MARPIGTDSTRDGARFTPGPLDRYVLQEMLVSVQEAAAEPLSGKRYAVRDPLTMETLGHSGLKTLKPDWMRDPTKGGRDYFGTDETEKTLTALLSGTWPKTAKRDRIAEAIDTALHSDAEIEKGRAFGAGVDPRALPEEEPAAGVVVPFDVPALPTSRPRVGLDDETGTLVLSPRSPLKGRFTTVNPPAKSKHDLALFASQEYREQRRKGLTPKAASEEATRQVWEHFPREARRFGVPAPVGVQGSLFTVPRVMPRGGLRPRGAQAADLGPLFGGGEGPGLFGNPAGRWTVETRRVGFPRVLESWPFASRGEAERFAADTRAYFRGRGIDYVSVSVRRTAASKPPLGNPGGTVLGPQHFRRGDRVTFVNRFGQRLTGRVVFALPTHLTLNMGGPHGTPAVVRYGDIVKVQPRRNPPGLDLDVDAPEKVPPVLSRASDAYGESAGELEAAWQDPRAGRPWAKLATVLDRAATSARKAVGANPLTRSETAAVLQRARMAGKLARTFAGWPEGVARAAKMAALEEVARDFGQAGGPRGRAARRALQYGPPAPGDPDYRGGNPSATIRLSPLPGRDWAVGPYHAEFFGARATVRVLQVELDPHDATLLKAVGVDNYRRFRPRGSLWWLRTASDPPFVDVVVDLITLREPPRRLRGQQNPPRVLGPIPGRMKEIRYQRTGRDRGPYYHKFGPNVRAFACADGSVMLRGPRPLFVNQ